MNKFKKAFNDILSQPLNDEQKQSFISLGLNLKKPTQYHSFALSVINNAQSNSKILALLYTIIAEDKNGTADDLVKIIDDISH